MRDLHPKSQSRPCSAPSPAGLPGRAVRGGTREPQALLLGGEPGTIRSLQAATVDGKRILHDLYNMCMYMRIYTYIYIYFVTRIPAASVHQVMQDL